jgi:hypothetical protein
MRSLFGRSRSQALLGLLAAAGLGPLEVASADEKPAQASSSEESRLGPGEPRPAPPAPEGSQAPAPRPALLYVPPELGFPGRRVGAATRGLGRHASLQLLAPDHPGLTTEEQPTLYWYLAEPTTARIDFTIRDETSVAPLLELEVSPAEPGIHALRLADHGVRLRPEENYQWFVSLVVDPERRSKDFSAGAWIRRGEADATLSERLAAAADGHEVFAYAESGFFYEAIRAASDRIAAAPADPVLREQRAALLEQVGLSEVAAWDRAALER